MPATAGVGRAPPASDWGRRLRQLLQERWRQGLAFGLLITTVDLLRTYSVFLPQGLGAIGAVVAEALVYTVTVSMATFIAVQAVAATSLEGWRRWLAVLSALVAGNGASVLGIFAAGGVFTDGSVLTLMRTDLEFALRQVWIFTAAGLLLTAYYVARDREAAMTRAAQAAELERARAERSVLESRLKVMQARVEPDLLFEALTDVQRLYAERPEAADALLDDLIAYLRAALPQMRGGDSTLAREAALAESCLRVLPAGRGGRLVSRIRVPDDLANEPFPPMVLLPLVYGAAQAGGESVAIAADYVHDHAPAARERCVTVSAVAGAIPAAWTDAGLETVRATLRQYFGPMATLEVAHAGGSVEATARWLAAGG
jgi:hypothetical protein